MLKCLGQNSFKNYVSMCKNLTKLTLFLHTIFDVFLIKIKQLLVKCRAARVSNVKVYKNYIYFYPYLGSSTISLGESSEPLRISVF